MENILSSLKNKPLLVICEYNAKFPFDSKWKMPYSEEHIWDGTDYFGASLGALVDLGERFGFFLAACSAQGSNAFFVNKEYLEYFADIPKEIKLIFANPVYSVVGNFHSSASRKTLSSILFPS